MSEFDRYEYSGHSCIEGRVKRAWQDRDSVLAWFGGDKTASIRAYRGFVAAGIDQGKRPDLVGGGLVRSLGGWSEVQSMRQRHERRITDDRVLGSGKFVEKLLSEVDEKMRRLISPDKQEVFIGQTIDSVCAKHGILGTLFLIM